MDNMLVKKYNYEKISRNTVEGKRLYSLPDGSAVPSVTTILDRTKPKEKQEALNRWRKSVGEDKAREITTEAANRGTRMHKWLEDYVENDRNMGAPGTNPYSQQSFKMAEQIVEHGLKYVDEIWGIEVPLYVPGLYAGTTDACGVYKGKPCIIDYKQTNKPKKTEWIEDYFLQLTAYGTAHNEVHGTDINSGVIMMCSKDYEYQTWTIEGAEWNKWQERWFDRVEQYYKLA
jgi:genome maintenance exonuclease 1